MSNAVGLRPATMVLGLALGACSGSAPAASGAVDQTVGAEARVSAAPAKEAAEHDGEAVIAQPTATQTSAASNDPPKYDAAAFADVKGPPCDTRNSPPTIAGRTDSGLRASYEAHRADKSAGRDDGISVSMRFCGKLAPILAMGLTVAGPLWEPGSIMVIVRYADLPRIVTHPGVVFLAAGSPDEID